MELRESSDGQLCEHLPGSYCCGPVSSPGVNAISLISNRPLKLVCFVFPVQGMC